MQFHIKKRVEEQGSVHLIFRKLLEKNCKKINNSCLTIFLLMIKYMVCRRLFSRAPGKMNIEQFIF